MTKDIEGIVEEFMRQFGSKFSRHSVQWYGETIPLWLRTTLTDLLKAIKSKQEPQ